MDQPVKWEYDVFSLKIGSEKDQEKIRERLRTEGAKGWELVSVNTLTSGLAMFVVKRSSTH